MAKASTPATAPVASFKIETGVALPTVTRAVGAASSPFTEPMKGMAVPKAEDGSDMQSFFVPVTVPASITDAAEREKTAKEEARKTSNRISGIKRRLEDQVDADNVPYAFALRTKQEKVGKETVWGVRVYRIAPAPKAPAAAAAQ